MDKIFKTVLLLALPASGKSEVRKYLDSLSKEELKRDFHMGDTVQLDDYLFVHMMRRVDEEYAKLGKEGVFFFGENRPYKDKASWGVLQILLNEDYNDLLTKKIHSTENAAAQLLKRMDNAFVKLGRKPLFYENGKPILPENEWQKILANLEPEARDMVIDKQKQYPETFEGKTLVIEFARGGDVEDGMPLPAGYEYCLRLLDPKILNDSAILYIWVTPEDSRRKNEERAKPNASGDILFHGVPIEVMLRAYGCDDIDYLIKSSDKPGFVKVQTAGSVVYVPIAKFDNRGDKTSFIRNSEWKPEETKALRDGIKQATDELIEHYAGALK